MQEMRRGELQGILQSQRDNLAMMQTMQQAQAKFGQASALIAEISQSQAPLLKGNLSGLGGYVRLRRIFGQFIHDGYIR